ncbi:MAG: FAD-dependent oxidoreductase [Pseudomonadota bacterium]|nr:FAD-dependent oxidoreductase [Pseudomonadota bacterium]
MSRIGIIGGGPGGLSLARLLTERKIADVVVLERDAQVGGKSLTVTVDGLGHEVGTCYLTTGYRTVQGWMREAGMSNYPLKHHVIHTELGETQDFKAYVLGKGGPMKAGLQMARYVADWLVFHEWDIHGCRDDTKGTRGGLMKDEMAQPFGEWLKERELDVIARFALRTMSIMGYGGLDEVPALYGLRWNVPSIIWSAVTLQVSEMAPGWQHLWVHLASKLDVRTDQHIREVTRADGKYQVRTKDGLLEFDHLVLTTRLHEARGWFPFTEEEVAAYSIGNGGMEWREYVTTLVDAEGWFQEEDTHSFEAAADGTAALSQSRLLVARRTGDKTRAAAARSRTRRDVYVCYQVGNPDLKAKELQDILERDLHEQGARNISVLQQFRWTYSPQFTPAAIRAGAAHAMEKQQGTNNLWISGATTSHESIDNITDFNERLVERMVMKLAGRAPSDEDALAEVAARFRWRISDK